MKKGCKHLDRGYFCVLFNGKADCDNCKEYDNPEVN